MSNLFAKAGIAALIALGAISATAATASANDFHPGIQQARYDHYRGRICSPGLAVQKARDMGLRRARIDNITPRRVVVEGFGRRGPDRVVFANVRGCPLIRR
ncbi:MULTISPECIES: hypothetical protein [Rhizobium]|jgi:hypothetical protein|uniref:Antifreeze protein n=1 Tax=Rhizobium tropici TaxID=398 RepID=A0A329YAE3_RHITR|nr:MULTISPECIES: hypothetical protein [Rhizobium]MBB3291258.1 hypothetical protein [Rhizobium sp. BK252]MBB3406006.1 hypothetical protein [Rhizobium sp. BK289]MBB3418585.1 hypothetical protein [Rhizobium sp. BK284]MBB3486470.1 hypothetical protein [Rhizobium sp. BK347]MDK4720880.1 hypothetical protein [Rhizobium sp. CNPSo 3968]